MGSHSRKVSHAETPDAARSRSSAHSNCITTPRYSEVLSGTQQETETAAQAPDLQVRLALTRRRSGVRVPQRPPPPSS
jgi:hypothetical protein